MMILLAFNESFSIMRYCVRRGTGNGTDIRYINTSACPLPGKHSIYYFTFRRMNVAAAATKPAPRRTKVPGSGTVVTVIGVNSATEL